MSKDLHNKDEIIKEKVMDKISSGKLHMHSKFYYVLLGALVILMILFLVILATYFTSISTLWLRIQTSQGPAYGAKRNLVSLLGSFPWWSLFLGILSLIGIIFIMKKFGKIYKLRLIYFVPLVIVIIILLGLLFSYSLIPINTFNNRKGNNVYLEIPGNINRLKGYQFNK